MDATELLTIDDVAKALGLSRKTIANKIARGDIPAVKAAIGRWRVHVAVLAALRAGLEREQIEHVAQLVRARRTDPQLRRLVEEYVARQVST